MHGSSRIRLLAIFIMICLILAAPISVRSQAAVDFSHHFSAPISSPHLVVPELPERVVFQATPTRSLPTPGTPLLFQVIRAAGTIFSGRVTAIAHSPASSSHPTETVSITFHVDHAFRGAVTGQELTITQWIGLWSAGQRYRVGECVLLFLYPPSKLGLTSSVAGPLGRFSVDAYGRVVLSGQHTAAFAKDPILGEKSTATLNDFSNALRASEED